MFPPAHLSTTLWPAAPAPGTSRRDGDGSAAHHPHTTSTCLCQSCGPCRKGMARSPRAPTGADSNSRPPTCSCGEVVAFGGFFPEGLSIRARVRHGWRSARRSHGRRPWRWPCSCVRGRSHRYSSGTLPLGAFPSAATVESSSALSLPVTPWCAGIQRTVAPLSLPRIREQASMAATAKR